MATAGNRHLAAAWARVRTRFTAMPARTRRLNLGLLLLLVAAIVATVLVIGDPGTPVPVARTATVTRGDVTALVTGSGNAESSLSTPVSFPSSGTVTSVDVAPGDAVTLGQPLATIDDATAQAELRTAEAKLAGARAELAQAQAGPTDVQAQQDQLAITQAEQAVADARAAVTAAEKQRELDRVATATAIENAKARLANEEESTATAVENAEEKLETDTAAQETLVEQAAASERAACGNADSDSPDSDSAGAEGDSDSGSSSCASAKLATENAENTRDSVLQADRQAVTVAKQTREATLDEAAQAVTEAEQARAETLLAGETTVETNAQAVTRAEGELTAARLAAEANRHPRTPEEIAQVQATVDGAQVEVDTARRGVEQTVLTAPQAGVVLAVNGEVGAFTEGPNAGSGDASSGGDGENGDSAGSEAAASAGDGFVVIANLSELAVTADIPEADAAELELGQRAAITFPGTDATATGSVTRITPQSTVSNDVVLYPVTISLDAAPDGVGVGSTANLSVTTGTAQDVLKVPTQAITTTGDRHTVTVRRGGTDAVVPVTIGVAGPAETEITGGVAEGDVLVLPSPGVTTGGSGAGFPGAGGR
ncbi:HlyD family efflux transporter periplasmic adaptor subunit [Pseudonocardia kunmingensis]|uniref:HlyD family secretion protein n=1 Tax=Pseudonocardia kunmingensis TaxID=630975 RepID=A0A543CYI0_9PSEU|nr:HlyD family efflux transporter periplasmic adaptor subunit [Pseudonocardia kunmingensis]TQM02135.1 HlyD family secretion protein [Pseudonocardia kunmingensis]